VTTLAGVVVTGGLSAQELGTLQQPPEYSRGRNATVLERPKPGWDPIPMHVGAFYVYPEVALLAGATSNQKKAPSGEESDTFFRVRPGVRIASNWSRHGVGVDAWASRQIYAKAKEDNSTDYNISGRGRLDIVRDFYLDLEASHARLLNSRLDPEVPADTIEPIYRTQDTASLRLVRTVSRMQLAFAATAQKDDFGLIDRPAGGTYNFNMRDRDYVSYGGRVTYAVSPDFAVFGAVLSDKAERPNSTVGSLDAKSASVVGGANFDLSNLARGEIAVGYLRQVYDRPGAKTDSGVAVNTELQWFPTQLTTVSLAGSRRTAPSFDIESPGGIDKSVSIGVDHELLRNVILSGRASYVDTDFAIIDRRDKQARLGAGASYRMNRNLRFDLGYNYTDQQSRGFNARRSFKDHTVSLTLFAYK
jgi:hypothetical protein